MRFGDQLWRHLEGDDGAGGGAPAGGAPAADPPAPPAPPSAPSIDPAEHARVVVELARAQARVEFPQADLEVLNLLTDPAAIATAAQRTHELAQRASSNGSPGNGAPVPASNAAGSAPSAEEVQLRRWQHQVRQRRTRGPRTELEPYEAEDARDAFFRRSWNNHMEHRRAGRGNVGEPPRFTPAAAALPAPGQAF